MNDIEILKKDIEKVELPLVNCNSGVIEFDLSNFKNQIQELVEVVKEQNLSVKNADEFYKLRAKLNKFSKQINDEKKKVKNEYTKPYTAFENQVKECINMIDNASGFIDDQLKAYEGQQQQILREEYIELWKSFGKDDVVPFERIENQKKWYLKSTPKKDVYLELKSLNDKIETEINILTNSIQDKDELAEVKANYYCSLDLGKELGEYTKWKNTIRAKEIIKEVVVEKQPEIATEQISKKEQKTIPPIETKRLEPKFEGENQEKEIQTIISFTATEELVDYIINYLQLSGVKKLQFRKNK